MNNPIQTALCAFGMSGRLFHAPFIHVNSGYNLYGVVERHKNSAHEIYPAIKSFDSFDEMIADNNIELVIVNTPNDTHFDFARKALLAGKHVVVEKPFVITAVQGNDLIELAGKQQKKISVYQNRRWDSDYKMVKKIVDENQAGSVVEAEFHFDRYKIELSTKAHKETPSPGAGILYDLGPHLIDQALQLFGYPQSVFADIVIMRRNSSVDDYFELLLYYPDKRIRLKASNLVKKQLPAYIIHGTKGSFIKSRADMQEEHLLAGIKPGGHNWGIEPETEKGMLYTKNHIQQMPAPRGNYMEFYDQMFEAIREDKPVPVRAEEATEVIRIIEGAQQSNKEGKVFLL